MHEKSLMTDFFRKIKEIASTENVDQVTKIHVKLGALSHISAKHFRQHFDEIKTGTVAENAEVIITEDGNVHDPRAQDITLISVDVPGD
jgi:hydrogenase nickel incorporation protein HypA/HybF